MDGPQQRRRPAGLEIVLSVRLAGYLSTGLCKPNAPLNMLETASPSAADHRLAKDRTYHTTSSPYALPNDAAEHRRLDDQNAACLALMRARLLHCPLPAPGPTRILDVGAGSGATTLRLAATFPCAATVVGLDLSPIPAFPPAPTGSSGAAAAVQGDFLAPAFGELPAVVRDGGFDLVFSRLLVMGVNDWDLFFARVREVLRPGTGWVETQELDQVWYDAEGRRCSDGWGWLEALRAAAGRRGMDFECARKAEGRMRGAGLVDVRTERFLVPLGEWEGHPEGENVMGRFARRTLRASLQGALVRMLREDGVEEQRVQELKEGVLPDEVWGKGVHRILTVTCGRRP